MAIGDLIDKFTNKFTETIFYKRESELEYQIQAIKKLLEKYPNDERLIKKLKISELGLKGEKEIEFELKNANIGMYVLHDINLEYKDLKAQIDYFVITPANNYLIECKNLYGNISVDNKGNFSREYQYGKKKYKEGIYSPLRQADRHVEVLKKIWSQNTNKFLQLLTTDKRYKEVNVGLAVMANSKNVLDLRYAPQDVKRRTMKSDQLVEFIKREVEKTPWDMRENKDGMNQIAYNIMQNYNKDIDRDYEKELEEWLLSNPNDNNHSINTIQEVENDKLDTIKDNNTEKVLDIRKRLIEYRKEKSREKNIPAYYIFNNDELDRILVLMPKTKQDLINAKILTEIKIKLHGDEIIKILNEQ